MQLFNRSCLRTLDVPPCLVPPNHPKRPLLPSPPLNSISATPAFGSHPHISVLVGTRGILTFALMPLAPTGTATTLALGGGPAVGVPPGDPKGMRGDGNTWGGLGYLGTLVLGILGVLGLLACWGRSGGLEHHAHRLCVGDAKWKVGKCCVSQPRLTVKVTHEAPTMGYPWPRTMNTKRLLQPITPTRTWLDAPSAAHECNSQEMATRVPRGNVLHQGGTTVTVHRCSSRGEWAGGFQQFCGGS